MGKGQHTQMRYPTLDEAYCQRIKEYSLRECTKNVRSLNWKGPLLVDFLERLGTTRQVRRRVCDIYYSDHIEKRKVCAGFMVRERLRRRALPLISVDERLTTKGI